MNKELGMIEDLDNCLDVDPDVLRIVEEIERVLEEEYDDYLPLDFNED